MNSIIVNGVRQVFHVAGHGPVMIAHSGGPGAEYSYLRSAALEEHFTMVYLEPVGTGESGRLPSGGTYMDTYVDFLYAVVQHLNEPRVLILGHSHGGLIAQRFALRYPERVAGLVLYSATPTTDAAFWAAATAEVAAYAERYAEVPGAAEAAAAIEAPKATTDEEATARLRAALPLYFADFWGRQDEFGPLRESIRSWAVQPTATAVDLRPDLPSITAPTVVLTGREDFICGPVWAEMLHHGIPGSELVIIENCGHFAQVEQPEEFLAAATRVLVRAA